MKLSELEKKAKRLRKLYGDKEIDVSIQISLIADKFYNTGGNPHLQDKT